MPLERAIIQTIHGGMTYAMNMDFMWFQRPIKRAMASNMAQIRSC